MEAKKNSNGDKQEAVGEPKSKYPKTGEVDIEVDMKSGEEGKGRVGGSTPKDQVGHMLALRLLVPVKFQC
ncbi:MAG: hypothetical protein GY804_11775 [Alphaproteobacteria bacterium]|nr:hypothetical protein [Alphaproteobacteria bacterium]